MHQHVRIVILSLKLTAITGITVTTKSKIHTLAESHCVLCQIEHKVIRFQKDGCRRYLSVAPYMVTLCYSILWDQTAV